MTGANPFLGMQIAHNRQYPGDGISPTDEQAEIRGPESERLPMELVIKANAGAEDKLFGSVGPIDIAEAFEGVQIEVQRSEIRMPDGPIHALGEYPIGIHLHPEVNAEVTVRVVSVE